MGKREFAKQGSLYLVVGAGTALLELVLFQALYGFGVLPVAAANVVAVVVSTALNFLVNGTVTFKGAKNPLFALAKYLILFAFNTCFSTTVISLAVSAGCPSLLAKLATMACIVCWNFVLYRKVVFK